MPPSLEFLHFRYVRKKVKSGRYNNASEVVRDARRRMDDEDTRAVRLALPSAEDIVADLTGEQLDGIRHRVRASIESIDAGDYREYEGRDGLKKLLHIFHGARDQMLAFRKAARRC